MLVLVLGTHAPAGRWVCTGRIARRVPRGCSIPPSYQVWYREEVGSGGWESGLPTEGVDTG